MLKETRKTWKLTKPEKYDNEDIEMVYTALALGGEAGELQNKVKKHFRHKYYTTAHASDSIINEVGEEIADILYYTFRLADLLNLDPSDVFSKKMEENHRRYNESAQK